MSTYWGFACRCHTPNLESAQWDARDGTPLVRLFERVRAGDWPEDEDGQPEEWDGYTAGPILWLREHPNCVVELISEYGEVKALPSRWSTA